MRLRDPGIRDARDLAQREREEIMSQAGQYSKHIAEAGLFEDVWAVGVLMHEQRANAYLPHTLASLAISGEVIPVVLTDAADKDGRSVAEDMGARIVTISDRRDIKQAIQEFNAYLSAWPQREAHDATPIPKQDVALFCAAGHVAVREWASSMAHALDERNGNDVVFGDSMDILDPYVLPAIEAIRRQHTELPADVSNMGIRVSGLTVLDHLDDHITPEAFSSELYNVVHLNGLAIDKDSDLARTTITARPIMQTDAGIIHHHKDHRLAHAA